MQELMFEGSEKKLELMVSPTGESLRKLPDSFWQKLCKTAKTSIVSRFSNSFCDSYILSESSLFVWDHRLLLLTCGKTPLVKALMSLIKKIKESERDLLFYQRKNEFFPYGQTSSFRDDLKKIQKKIKGQAFCFGPLDEHHFYLFHSDKHSSAILHPDRTIEILMYDLDEHIKQLFFKANKAKDIRDQLGLDRLFEGAEINDHIFKPVGYSLNGLIGSNYYTIHVTPQDPGFYVSFETNNREENLNNIVEKLVTLFKPLVFDVIVFSSTRWEELSGPSRFARSSFYSQNLECGYKVGFYSFFTPFKEAQPARQLSIGKGV